MGFNDANEKLNGRAAIRPNIKKGSHSTPEL